MKPHSFVARTLGFLMLAFVVSRCGGGGGGPGSVPAPPEPDPFAGYTADPAVYSASPDPARILSVSAGVAGAPDLQFPVDQMILLMERDTPRTDVEHLAESLEGEIVGQVPDRDFYQLRVPAATRAELDAAIARAEADPDVVQASYNLLGIPMQCPPPSDLQDALFLDEDRCPFIDIDYYNAITIFDHIRPQVALSEVWVAVVDTGIQANNGEFDDVHVLNLAAPRTRATDFDGHGTMVASLIAADNDGAGINGLASRFLGRRLLLLSAGIADFSFASYYAAAERAMDAGPDVVNISSGWASYTTGIDLSAIRASWDRMIEDNPEVLFVCAADNEPYDLTGTNYAPGGIARANVITVGGTARCAPDDAWPLSATGPRINLAAPAAHIPVASLDNGHVIVNGSGNSLASPMVAALAAILKSIDPSLSPRMIRDNYLTMYGMPTDASVSGARINMAMNIEQLLVDMGSETPAPVLDLLDADGNDRYDNPAMVINRMCGGLQYRVTGYGAWDYSNEELDRPGVSALGNLGEDVLRLESIVPEDQWILMGCGEGCPFALDTPYPVSRDYDTLPGTMGMSWVLRPGEPIWPAIGIGISGVLVFDTCRVDERYPFTNLPFVINVTGSFDGVLEVAEPGLPGYRYTDTEGFFSLPFTNLSAVAPAPVNDYIEENCEGGYPTR